MPRQHWTKEKVIERIHARKAEGKRINYQAVVNDEEKLAGAARRLFGSWNKALEAAGFDPEKEREPRTSRQKWSKTKIVDAIRELHERGEELSAHHVQKINSALVAAAYDYFGSWGKAVQAAGFDYADIKKTGEWTPEKIVERLRELHSRGAQINYQNLSVYDPPLCGAIITHYGSWENAVRAAGLDPDEIRLNRKWTKQSLLEEAQKLIKAGIPISAYLLNYDFAMQKAVYRFYGNLDNFYRVLEIKREKETVLPNRLREARKAKKLSLEEVGKRLGLSHRAVSMMELMQTPVTLQRALQFSRLYEMPVEELFPLPENALQSTNETGPG
mgnify:CR=1 FL=1